MHLWRKHRGFEPGTERPILFSQGTAKVSQVVTASLRGVET